MGKKIKPKLGEMVLYLDSSRAEASRVKHNMKSILDTR